MTLIDRPAPVTEIDYERYDDWLTSFSRQQAVCYVHWWQWHDADNGERHAVRHTRKYHSRGDARSLCMKLQANDDVQTDTISVYVGLVDYHHVDLGGEW